MITIEKSLWLVFCIGLVLRLLKIPGNSILIVIPLLSLCILYFLFSFILFNKISVKRIFKIESYQVPIVNMVHAFLSGIGLSVLIAGILYKLMHYNEGNLLTYIGLTISGIVLIWLLFIKKVVNYQGHNMIAIRFITSIGIAIMSLIIV
jgi:hypothetical protein